MRIFDRAPGYDAQAFAEAQSLLDDGLSRELVLSLFSEEAQWLRPLLETSRAIGEAAEAESAREGFQTELRHRFLAAAARSAQAPLPIPVMPLARPAAEAGSRRVRTFAASSVAAAGAMAAGVLALAVFTSNGSDSALDTSLKESGVQIRQIEERIEEGEVTDSDFADFEEQLDGFTQILHNEALDEAEKEKAARAIEAYKNAARAAAASNPDLADRAAAAEDKIGAASEAAGIGTVEPIPTPPGTPIPTAEPTATPTASATATASETATASPEATPTAAESAEQPLNDGTPTPAPEATVSPTATP